MMKTMLLSLLFVIIFLVASISNIFAIIAHKVTFYVALVLLVVVFVVAIIVIRNHVDKGTKNEEDDK